ncbi:MAG: excisionase family DNA-binding protein [Oscillospiraceae bacterium]|nr:excisionase family DNA-binding protein [Oscillospiraceae bacterium]
MITNSTNETQKKRQKKYDVPIWNRSCLTLEEAAAYSGIGRDKLRTMSDRDDCTFVLWNGSKRLINRKKLDKYLESVFSI